MTEPPTESPKPCRACGRPMAPHMHTCPHCGAQQSPPREPGGELRPLGGAPARPAGPPPPPPPPRPTSRPVRDEPAPAAPAGGSVWDFARAHWKDDRWYAVLLALMVLQAALALITFNLLGLIIAGLLLWGLLTYNYWVFLIMVVVVGLGVFQGGLLLVTGQLELAMLPTLAVNIFIFAVLLARRDQFA